MKKTGYQHMGYPVFVKRNVSGFYDFDHPDKEGDEKACAKNSNDIVWNHGFILGKGFGFLHVGSAIHHNGVVFLDILQNGSSHRCSMIEISPENLAVHIGILGCDIRSGGSGWKNSSTSF